MINNTVQTNSETQWGSAMLNKECKLHIGKREKEGFSQQKVKWCRQPRTKLSGQIFH